MSKMSKRDYVTKFMDSIKNELLREINQGIITESATEKKIHKIINEKINNYGNKTH